MAQVVKMVVADPKMLAELRPEVQAAARKLLPKKRGRPVDPFREMLKVSVPGRSERTMTRLTTALRSLMAIVGPDRAQQEFLADCTRPNGSINVSKLLAYSIIVKRMAAKNARRARPGKVAS